jgi:uncharacterized protein
MRTRAFAIMATLAATALHASARGAPSFDCERAQSKAETLICIPETDLQWLDRQLARLFNLAKSVNADRDQLTVEQRQFLGRRDACGADSACITRVYKDRLHALAGRVNVYEAFAEFKREEGGSGDLWIARFGAPAAIKIGTSGPNGHECFLEADDAVMTGRGVAKWRGGEEDACHIDVIPDGEDMRVETSGCEYYCGARARFDGLFKRVQ